MTRIYSALIRRPSSKRFCRGGRVGPVPAGMFYIEIMAIVAIIAMLVGIATIHLVPQALRSRFDEQAQEFINTLKMAHDAASQSDRRYAVLLDLDEGSYTLQPFVALDADAIPLTEETIVTGYFTDDFRLDYVRFDDGQDTRNAETNATEVFRIWLLVGQSGWQNSAQIGVLDREELPYTIVVNRLSGVISMYEGEYQIPEPVENVPF